MEELALKGKTKALEEIEEVKEYASKVEKVCIYVFNHYVTDKCCDMIN